MRKQFTLVVVFLSCLMFFGQSIANASAGYSDCCLHGCEAMMQCANVACHACAKQFAAPNQEAVRPDEQLVPAWCTLEVFPRQKPVQKPWKPPD